MWSVFLFARRLVCFGVRFLWGKWRFWSVVLMWTALGSAYAVEGRTPFASLMAGGLSPVGLGGFFSTPARYADPSYGVSYYWTDDVDESSWNLSLEYGSEAYRVGAFIGYLSVDSLYRNLYSEVSLAKTWMNIVLGTSYGLDMEWTPGENAFGGGFWTRHRLKFALDFKWREIHLAGLLSGFTDEGVTPVVGLHWVTEESVLAFAECDFDYLYVGASFRSKFVELCSSYRFPSFAVALQISFSGAHYGAAYARGFKHNSIGWNGVHVTRWLKDGRRKIN